MQGCLNLELEGGEGEEEGNGGKGERGRQGGGREKRKERDGGRGNMKKGESKISSNIQLA